MSFGITKTVPQAKGQNAVDQLYDGSIKEFAFHKAGGAGRLEVGHYVYTIFQNEMIGRCRVIRLDENSVNPDSGKPRTEVYVACPGEKLKNPYPHPGHRGTRYYNGEGWPEK